MHHFGHILRKLTNLCWAALNSARFEGGAETAKGRNDGKNLLEVGRLLLETGRRATIRLGCWATRRVSRFPTGLPEISLPILRNSPRRWGPRRCGAQGTAGTGNVGERLKTSALPRETQTSLFFRNNFLWFSLSLVYHRQAHRHHRSFQLRKRYEAFILLLNLVPSPLID